MRLALVADLHGNLPALEAADRQLRALSPDEIWFLGDAVGKGPGNAAACDWVRENCARAVGGNWDYGIGRKQFSADGYFWDQLGPVQVTAESPTVREMVVPSLEAVTD